MKRYLGPPGSIIEGDKIPFLSPTNPLSGLPSNLISSDALRYVYDENEDIQCAVNPSNLVAPMKINDKLVHGKNSKSAAFHKEDGPVDLAKALRSLNPSFFNPNTKEQNSGAFIPDLLYHDELDKVDSLHNAMAHPHSFVPPPVAVDPQAAMTSQALNNVNYYPVTDNFFQKDQFKCYSTTMSLISQMNKEKPAHLKTYDRRFIDGDNVLATGNLLYKKNDTMDRRAQVPDAGNDPHSPSSQHMSPARDEQSTQKYGIVIDKAASENLSPQVPTRDPQIGVRQNIYSKNAGNMPVQEIEYHGKHL
jgi:hypothetical protein